jgi:hypothetical protein
MMASSQQQQNLIHLQTGMHELALILLSILSQHGSLQQCAQDMEMDEVEFMEQVGILMNHDNKFDKPRILDNRSIDCARTWLFKYPQLRKTNYFESQLVDKWYIINRRLVNMDKGSVGAS